MIFSTPVKFDENEWYVLIGFVVLLLIFIKLPRHFPLAQTFLLLLFTANLGITADYILATPYPFDAYDVLDTGKFDLFDVILSNFNYGLLGYIFIYFYDKWQLRGTPRLLFLSFWIGLSLLFEFVGTKLNTFKYNDWHLGYSFFCYLFIFSYYLLILKVVKLAFKQYQKGTNDF